MYSICSGLFCQNKGEAPEPGKQLGVLVRSLYPGRLGERGDRRPALSWRDYYQAGFDQGGTVAEAVVDEFWVKCYSSISVDVL